MLSSVIIDEAKSCDDDVHGDDGDSRSELFFFNLTRPVAERPLAAFDVSDVLCVAN